jgi:hypothetical protein
MTQWYRLSIVIGCIPASERQFLSSLLAADIVFDSASDSRKMTPSEVERWTEQLEPSEIRDKLRAGLAVYAAE